MKVLFLARLEGRVPVPPERRFLISSAMNSLVIMGLFIVFSCVPVRAEAPNTPLKGLCYGPFREGQRPGSSYPTEAQMRSDLCMLKTICTRIRTYGTEATLFSIPRLCSECGIDCYPGAWIAGDQSNNAREVSNLIQIAKASYPTTKGLIVGNQVLKRGDLSTGELITWINDVKAATALPVTTAATWYTWTNDANADLGAAVDFILLHVYANWKGVAVTNAAEYIFEKWNQVQQKYPDKQVVIGETGWPTAGPAKGGAVPGEAEQECFLRSFIELAHSNKISYFLFEAFDEPWKGEGGVAPHWGLMYKDRTFKPGLTHILSTSQALTVVPADRVGD